MSPMRPEAREAVALYAIAARDVVDFIELVNDERTSLDTLELLRDMLGHAGGPNTDVELNKILHPVVVKQIEHRKGSKK